MKDTKTSGNDGAFAFFAYGPGLTAHQSGLTKRELFAAMALQGILANSGIHERAMNGDLGKELYKKKMCSMAIDHADALIKALSKDKADEVNDG